MNTDFDFLRPIIQEMDWSCGCRKRLVIWHNPGQQSDKETTLEECGLSTCLRYSQSGRHVPSSELRELMLERERVNQRDQRR